MKNIKKKIVALVCMIVFCVALASCGSEEYTPAEQYAADVVEEFMVSLGEYADQLPDLLSTYAEYPAQYNSLKNFIEVSEQYGAYESYETESVTEIETDEYTVRGKFHFADADVESIMSVTVVVSTENCETGEITYAVSDCEAATFDKVKTFGEKMGNAGMNTLMGMGTVFIVLILISLIIYLFSFISKFENAMAKKAAAKEAKNAPAKQEAPAPAEVPAPAEAETDDTELVAVIAAAIAACEGTSPDGIVVRSIRKVSSAKTWKRG